MGDKVTPQSVYADIVQRGMDADRRREKLDAEIAKDKEITKDKFDVINDALCDALSVFSELDDEEDMPLILRAAARHLKGKLSEALEVCGDMHDIAPEAPQKAEEVQHV
jgi:hypothetical protein